MQSIVVHVGPPPSQPHPALPTWPRPHNHPWLDLLAARADGQPWALLLGTKATEIPRLPGKDLPACGLVDLSEVYAYLVFGGRLRARVRASYLGNGVEGPMLAFADLSPQALEPLTIAAAVPWFLGARDPWWRTWSAKVEPPARGKAGPKEPGDEQPYPGWYMDHVEPGVVSLAIQLGRAPAPPSWGLALQEPVSPAPLAAHDGAAHGPPAIAPPPTPEPQHQAQAAAPEPSTSKAGKRKPADERQGDLFGGGGR